MGCVQVKTNVLQSMSTLCLCLPVRSQVSAPRQAPVSAHPQCQCGGHHSLPSKTRVQRMGLDLPRHNQPQSHLTQDTCSPHPLTRQTGACQKATPRGPLCHIPAVQLTTGEGRCAVPAHRTRYWHVTAHFIRQAHTAKNTSAQHAWRTPPSTAPRVQGSPKGCLGD